MTAFRIQRAQRHQSRLRLALCGPSGSGKTMGALRVAKGLAQALIDSGQINGPLEGKVGVIDTERGSAALYSDVVPFDVLELTPPYSPERYREAIDALEKHGCQVIIIDQISHAWAGEGGLLEYVDTLKAQSRNAMSPWMKATPEQQRFVERLLASPAHLIVTMRAKSEWVMQEVIEDGRKKTKPQKIGMQPVQRDGIEYEFTTMLDIDLDGHTATASKDRSRLFMDRQTKLDENVGSQLARWLISGAPMAPDATPPAPPPAQADTGPATVGDTGKTREQLEKELFDGIADFQLSFIECHTLPDLAAQFDKAQKWARGFVPLLGAEAVKPKLDDLIGSKDRRKQAIQNPPEQTQPAAAPAEQASPQQPSAPGVPPAELMDKADGMGVEDVKRLSSFAMNEGLDPKETLEVLGVTDIAQLPKAKYAEATDKILAHARKKLKGGKRGSRQRAAA